ncbi:hypothetical protein ACFSDD_17570 [Salipiger marinus]|uniref:hypothetical protein n=1 Tax=Salipiger marinus TaxID=555512 RepID=UPI002B59BC41|nr:hypothetical protein [Salipiger manganoxidans]MEB3421749.1 hypothetical protein [Salipiger manganoxidans]
MTLSIERIEHGLILATSREHPALFAVGRNLSEVINCLGTVLDKPEWIGGAVDGCAEASGCEHLTLGVYRVSLEGFPSLFIPIGDIDLHEVPLVAERAFAEMLLRAEEVLAQESQRLQRLSELIRGSVQGEVQHAAH